MSISAQKPNSTGSGVFLTELVKAFSNMGHEQAVIAGVYEEDVVELPLKVGLYPVCFDTEELPFKIPGMSDEMPYESTVYSKMTSEMTICFKMAFRKRIQEVIEAFQPDIVLCHHLYLVTAIAREVASQSRIFGICHNTDLGQMKKTTLQHTYIKEQIRKLNGIFAINQEQKAEVISTYQVEESQVTVIGTGYNDNVFFVKPTKVEEGVIQMIFAGKISEKKGVKSLLRSLSYLPYEKESLVLKLAGGYGNAIEYKSIVEMAKECPYSVVFLGKLSQEALAQEYNKSQVFVLPSFFEGIPLTVIEALACGNKVVVTDLPGIRPFIQAQIKEAPVFYVKPPRMRQADEPVQEEIETFEQALAETIKQCIDAKKKEVPYMAHMTWEHICENILLQGRE